MFNRERPHTGDRDVHRVSRAETGGRNPHRHRTEPDQHSLPRSTTQDLHGDTQGK